MSSEGGDIVRILEGYRPLVDKAMEKLVPRELDPRQMAFELGEASYEFDEIAATKAVNEPIWDLLGRGGKRWRPALCLMIGGALGKKPGPLAPIAAAVEIIHNGSLMTDDLEDGSELRRGKPCIHLKYGVDVGVNAGNAMYFLALNAFLRGKWPKAVLVKAYEAYALELIRVHYGQGADIWWHRGGSEKVTEGQYLQMCAFKTGTLARLAAKWGAIFGGGSDAQIEAAGRLAESIGVAFQIQDDVLNLQGEEEKYGKEIGGDITEGKRTLLVIYALESAERDDAKRLLETLSEHTRDKKKLAVAIEIIKKSGAFEKANAKAREIVRKAWEEFDALFPQSKNKKELEMLAYFVIERSV
jgi:geranylgeranyl pyrophosphate synthase